MRNIIFILLVSLFFSFKSQSLNIKEDSILCYAIVIEGDTFPIVYLNQVRVESEMKFSSRRKFQEWNRLKYNVRKAYPYAIIAAAKLKEYEYTLSTIKNEDEKKRFIDKAETELKIQFEQDLKKLSISQGRILIKLIHRETGRTSYDLVKQLRGKFSAFMWQGLAKVFGSDLKSEYDSKYEDRLIEIAIVQIEAGN